MSKRVDLSWLQAVMRDECNPLRTALIEKFWRYVDKQDGPNACWLWTRAKRRGYGIFVIGGKRGEIGAHRFSFLIHYGEIPSGRLTCHHCDVPPCVRPDHLFSGTKQDNALDMAAKGRAHLQKNPMRFAGANNPRRRLPEINPRGSQHHKSKVTETQVIAMRERVASGERQNKLAKEYGLDSTTVNGIVLGDIWTHVGGPIKKRRSYRNVNH